MRRGIALCFEYIPDRPLEASFIVQPSLAAALRPPVLPNRPFTRAAQSFQLFQPPRTPGFELIHDDVGISAGRCYHDVYVLRAAVRGMQGASRESGNGLLACLPQCGVVRHPR
jgi:hypothetical protein